MNKSSKIPRVKLEPIKSTSKLTIKLTKNSKLKKPIFKLTQRAFKHNG